MYCLYKFSKYIPYKLSIENHNLSSMLEAYGAFPLHGTARYGTVRYGSLLGGFPLGTVPGTWYFFSTTSAEVPNEPYRYQNVMCILY